ncbi:hypothetical protein KXR87_18675 [Yokenella regensburgei]|uniref:hypothetical protein n=1 Tax=Yokenella regensburgei TaxID=158877 RepID=UPI003F14ECB4
MMNSHLLLGLLRIYLKQGVGVKNENVIIGEAIEFLLSTRPREEFSREALIEHLKRQYAQKYESSASLEEIELYERALKSVMFTKK